MAIVKWNPVRDLFGVNNDLNRLFDTFFNRYDEGGTWNNAWLPATDIAENDKAIEIKAELPGLTRDDIKITLQENILTISGEKKEEKTGKDKNYHRIERSYGSFSRRFKLPARVKGDKIEAEFSEGVLTLTVPKAEAVKPKEIKVRVK